MCNRYFLTSVRVFVLGNVALTQNKKLTIYVRDRTIPLLACLFHLPHIPQRDNAHGLPE